MYNFNKKKFELNETCLAQKSVRKYPSIKIPTVIQQHASVAIIILNKTVNYYHGLYYNIPAGTTLVNLDQNEKNIDYKYIRLNHGEFYSVPCPPIGTGDHEYYFKIYYLKNFAQEHEITDKDSFIDFIKENTVAKKSFVKTVVSHCPPN